MVKMLVRHKVAEFGKWKPVFDADDATRKKFGCTKSEVFTNSQNPNEVLAVLQWDTKEQALNFGHSPGLKDAMERGGVISTPEVSFAE
ncbi:MAG: cyclase [Saprospiraceae bacterium]|uniref:Cyclase n=1 Tax=Candidatus Opimibacter skivensis TaxID=2982028 RepID=A0A9D7XUP4_9BACT|nr:cyclase [Candidatus Opimibacter skivensis]